MRALGSLVFVVLILGIQGNANAQTFSPYSAIGIGDIYSRSMVQHNAMGGIGISNSSYFFQNTMNPALIADNGVYSFTTGFSGESKTIWQQEDREIVKGGNLGYINMIWPLKQGKVATSFGMMPYSRVNYNFKATVPVNGDPDAEVTTFNRGEGGFNQFIFSAGAKLTRDLYFGGNVAYVFSSIFKENNVVLTDPFGPYVPTTNARLTAGDFIFGLGTAYKKVINDDYRVNVGAIYNFQQDLSVTKFQTLISNTTTNTPIQIDTLVDNEKGYIHLPASYGVGISVEKLNKWMFGVDVNFQEWDNYTDFDGNNTELVNSLKLGVGGEFTPNISSVDNYFSRITYRFGFNLEQTPYNVRDTQIDELGMNFGLSLPVANFSTVDFGVRYGSRGTIDNNLIRENFVRIYFGVTFNDQRWFVRPKFN